MYELLESGFEIIVKYGILILEAIGVFIILISAVISLIGLIQRRKKSMHAMVKGITTALSFLLGSEALKTIIAPDWRDIGMTCAILLMRAAMSLLIHWETKRELELEEQTEKSDHNAATTGGAEVGK